MIYNYLLSINLSLTSDLILIKGSVVAVFQLEGVATILAQAAASMRDSPDSVPNLSIVSFNLNGRSSTVTRTIPLPTAATTATTTATTKTKTNDFDSVGLVIGLVIGLVVGILITVGVVFGVRKYQRLNRKTAYEQEEGPLTPITAVREHKPSILPRMHFDDLELKPLEQAYTGRWARSSSTLAGSGRESSQPLDLKVSDLNTTRRDHTDGIDE